MRRLVAALERHGGMQRLAIHVTEAGEVEISHETRQSESWRLKRVLKDQARGAAEPEQGHASEPALVDPAGPEGGA